MQGLLASARHRISTVVRFVQEPQEAARLRCKLATRITEGVEIDLLDIGWVLFLGFESAKVHERCFCTVGLRRSERGTW